MVNKVTELSNNVFEWLDITSPTEAELDTIASTYHLHPALVNDCLQPDHLPKYERMTNYSFIIFRIYTENDLPEADSVQELTNKIAIFYSENFLLTIHRQKQSLFDKVMEAAAQKKCASS